MRVIVLVEDEESQDEEKLWVKGMAGNPAFEFLQHPDEDIYTIQDGVPVND